MVKILIVMTVLFCAASACFAADQAPKATEPIGAVIETTGVFVGKIVGSTEQALTGEKKVTVKSDTGETMIFPFNETVEFVDKTFNILTFNQLKAGDDVTVKIKKALSK